MFQPRLLRITTQMDKACDIACTKNGKPDVFLAESRETPTFENLHLFKN